MLFIAQRVKRYVENATWLAFEKGFSLLAGVVVSIYVARYLGPEQFGLLNYAISLVSIFSALSALGLEQILVRELARNPEKKEALLGTGFVLKLAGSFFLMLVLMLVLAYIDPGIFINTLVMIIASAELFKSSEVINYFYQSQVQSKYVVQVQVVVNLVISLVKIALVVLQAPLIWFALIIVGTSLLNAAGFFYTYQVRAGGLWQWRFRGSLAFVLLGESWPMALYGVALLIQARIDQVMLGNMMSNYEVGQYSVALRFIEMFGFMPTILASTFMPSVSRAKISNEHLYDDRLVNFYRLMFSTFLLVAIPVYFFAEDIIMLLYGADYRAAGYLLSLFALRLFFSNMGVGKSLFISNEGLFKYALMTVVVGAVATISLNYFLIPVYGMIGSVAASMISFTISIFLIDVFLRKTRHNLKLMFRGLTSFWDVNNVR
jgi:O-antigen/teichoic acid export membrane protein